MDRARPKGPDYIIIDNFLDIFESLEQDDLINAKSEVKAISETINR